jgi:hypothetical protein
VLVQCLVFAAILSRVVAGDARALDPVLITSR